MLCLIKNRSLFLLIAVSCALFAPPAWSASQAEQPPGKEAELKSIATGSAAVSVPDKFKPTSTDRGSTSSQDIPLYKYAVKAVKACGSGKEDLNLPGSLLVALPSGEGNHMRLRMQNKAHDVRLGLVLNGTFMEGTFPQDVSIPQDMSDPQIGSLEVCSAAFKALQLEQFEQLESDLSKQDLFLFRLSFNAKYRAAWESVLSGNQGNGIVVSVGFSDGEAYFSDKRINIQPSCWDWAASAALAVLMVGCFIMLIKHSRMLREPPDHYGFSLGRTQMAWWTILALWGFFFIYQYTGTANLTNSVVILMGISSATALGAALIDKAQGNQEGDKKEAVTASITKPQGIQVEKRDYFLAKLLSDPGDPLNDYSLHRVQIFCWNLVMSYVFLRSVVMNYTMPEFDSTMLGLMGLSSAAYLGFKRQEQAVVVPTRAG